MKLIRLNEFDQETTIHYVIGRDSELTSLKPPKKIYNLIYKSIANSYYDYMMSLQQLEGTQGTSAVENTAPVTDSSEQETAADTSHMTDEQLAAYYQTYAEYYQQYYATATEHSPMPDTDTSVQAVQLHDTDHNDDVPPEELSPFPELDALIKAAKDKLIETQEQSESDGTADPYSSYYQYMAEQTAALERAYAAAATEQEEPPRLSTWIGTKLERLDKANNVMQVEISNAIFRLTTLLYRTITAK